MKKGLSALLLASLLCASSGCQQNQKESGERVQHRSDA
jgi:hexosaminidase